MTQRRSDALKYRYGKCLNEDCEKGKSKEVIQLPARKDFICPECQKPLRECPPPKKPFNWMLYGGIGAAVVAIGVGAILLSNKSDSTDDSLQTTEITQEAQTTRNPATDSLVKPEDNRIAAEDSKKEVSQTADDNKKNETSPKGENTPKANASEAANASSGNLSLPYGKYNGAIRNGKPHGQGTLTYTTECLIDPRDSKQRYAQPGEYIIGEWDNGHLVQGRWFKNDSSKEVIILGKAG